MNIGPANQETQKLPCPHCGAVIPAAKTSDWFSCPRCKGPVRIKAGDGFQALEAGTRSETIRPIQFNDADEKKEPFFLQTMPLKDLRTSKVFVEDELSRLHTEKIKISEQISRGVQKNQNTQVLRNRLSNLESETDEYKDFKKQLDAMESILLQERIQAVDASSSAGNVFGCSLILLLAALVIFGWIASVVWNWKSIVGLVVIVAVTSVMLYFVAAPKKGD